VATQSAHERQSRVSLLLCSQLTRFDSIRVLVQLYFLPRAGHCSPQKGTRLAATVAHPPPRRLTSSLASSHVPNAHACSVKLAQLDIVDDAAIKRFVEIVKRDSGGIDILINNAGFAFKSAATESMSVQAEKTIAVNYFGTKVS
jgi:NAD(P)-dependent dehydrogenase (short-subunit alcohol dehydrogenase family)